MILFTHCPSPTLKCHVWNAPKGLIFQLEKKCLMLTLPEKGLQFDCITVNNLDSLSYTGCSKN